MIDSILIKIKNDNFDFNDEELKLIKENDDLGKEFVDRINRLYDSFILNKKDTTSYDNLIKYMAKNDLMSDLVYNSLNNNAMFPLILDALDNNFCDYEFVISYINEKKLDSNLSEKLINYYYESITKNNYEEVVIYSQKSIEILLELKRYDLIEKAKINTDLSDTLIDKLFEIFGEKIINIDFEINNSELDFNEVIDIVINKIKAKEDYKKYLLTLSKAKMYSLDVSYDYDLLFSTIPELYKKIISERILETINSNKNINGISSNFFNQGNNFMIFLNISEKLVDYIINNYFYDEQFINKINPEALELIFNIYLKKTKLNKKHLVELKSRVGYKIFMYLKNKNIEELINLDDLNFQKVMNLFPDGKYSVDELKVFYKKVKLKEFAKENRDTINIGAAFVSSLSDNTLEYLSLIGKLETVMDENFYIVFNEKYKTEFNSDKSKSRELLMFIADKIKNGDESEKEKYYEILRFITGYYIEYNRQKYIKSTDIYKDFQVISKYDEKNLQNTIVDYLLKNNFLEINYKNQTISFYDALIEEMNIIGIEKELAIEIISFYNTRTINNSKFSEKEVKSNVKQMKLLATKLTSMLSNDDIKLLISKLDDKVRKIYEFPEGNKNSELLQILSELNINSIKNNILSNDDIYNSLLKIFKKYRPHLLPTSVLEYIQNSPVNILYNSQDLAMFIMNYLTYYKNGNIEEISLYKLLEDVSQDTTNNIGYAILGEEDYKLIRANPKPNSAQTRTTPERVKESVQRTIQNFKRNQVAVPTFNEVINLGSGKKIRVVVGNFTHPCNLTHGERTGACMRIGGAFDSLYKFCLDNPFGFHIRFEDPETGEYISRVSGFRNGNSVFLNQLSDSCNNLKYSNFDIALACKTASDMIIEQSKDSMMPIDNVCITERCAMIGTKYPRVNLGVDSVKTGHSYFDTNIEPICIALSTSSTNSEFVPVNFDNSNVNMYLPAREVVEQITYAKIASQRINRVNLVKKCLENEYIDNEYIIPLNDVVY